jgi:hypothetical protein
MQEPVLNAMLELARRNLNGPTTIKVFDNEFNIATFQTLTPEDITGIGRIKPVGARHFTEQAELVQNLTSLTGSNLWPTVQPHFSGVKTAKLLEETFDIEDYGLVTPFIALAEQAEGQQQAQVLEELMHNQTMTATGVGSDYDMNPSPQTPVQQPQNPKPKGR